MVAIESQSSNNGPGSSHAGQCKLITELLYVVESVVHVRGYSGAPSEGMVSSAGVVVVVSVMKGRDSAHIRNVNLHNN